MNTRTNETSRIVRNTPFTPLPIYRNNQENLTLNRSQNLVLMNRRWLSPCLIDHLAEAQQNWINLLQQNWVVEVYNLSLLSASYETNSLKHRHIRVEGIVSLTAQAPYQRLVVAQQAYSCYTCCLHIAGLGRVRLVIAFDHPERTGNYGVLLTNCLTWSPQTILSYWLEGYSAEQFYRNQTSKQQVSPRKSSETELCCSIA